MHPNSSDGSSGEPESDSDEEARGMNDLQTIFDMLSRTPDARENVVSEIRDELAAGTYMTEDRLNVAIYRLLKDILEER